MFNCVCIDDYEPSIVSSTKFRKARKEHTCCECDKIIPKGVVYEYVSGLWDQRWSDFKTCMTCYAIRRDFMSCGWIYGELWSTLQDIYNDFGEDADWLRP